MVDFKPAQYIITTITGYTNYHYFTMHPVNYGDGKKKIRIYITEDNVDKYLHLTATESAISYNQKIDERIGKVIEDSSVIFNDRYSWLFKGVDLKSSCGSVEPVPLVELLLKAGKTITKPVGYILLSRRSRGISFPWYIAGVTGITTTPGKQNITILGSYFGKKTINLSEYGKDVLDSVYRTKEDLLSNYDINCGIEYINNQVEKKIDKLEKQKILI